MILWLALALKVPIVALLYLVWWAVKDPPEAMVDDEGGSPDRDSGPHPRDRPPRPPRRGPHGDPAVPSPPRVRTVSAKAREHQP